MSEHLPIPVRVEARGVLCPVPIIRLARVSRTLPAGTLVEVLSDDPAARHDIPAWCRLRGHELVAVTAVAADEPPADLPDGAEPEVGRPESGEPLSHLIRLAG